MGAEILKKKFIFLPHFSATKGDYTTSGRFTRADSLPGGRPPKACPRKHTPTMPKQECTGRIRKAPGMPTRTPRAIRQRAANPSHDRVGTWRPWNLGVVGFALVRFWPGWAP